MEKIKKEYIKPIIVKVNLNEDVKVFHACKSYQNDSDSCYS